MEMGRDVAEIPRGLNLFMWECHGDALEILPTIKICMQTKNTR